MPRIFTEEELSIGKKIKLPEKTFHYVINVMRSHLGDRLILVNGRDGEFSAEIIAANNKNAIVEVKEKTREYREQPFMGLIFAPIRNLDIVLKSATELGVTNFLPTVTEYTNRANTKMDKMLGNIIEAVEQSERLDLPTIGKIEPLKKILDKLNDDKSVIYFCEERSNQNTMAAPSQSGKKIYALVGPEGGFSENEKKLIKSYGSVVSVSLGENILRTETATIAVLSILNWEKYGAAPKN